MRIERNLALTVRPARAKYSQPFYCSILSETRAEERCEGESKDLENASSAMPFQGVSTRDARPFSSSIDPGTASPVPSSQPDLPIADSSFQSAQSSSLCASLSIAV